MKISDFYSLALSDTNYIIYSIRNATGEDIPDYLEDEATAKKLDLLYRDFHSGEKTVSPYVCKTLKNNSDNIILTNSTLANSIILLFKDKWDKLYNSLVTANYDALGNYDLTEIETPDLETENTTRDSVYGFDDESEDGVKKDLKSYVSNVTGTNTKTRQGRDGKVTAQKMLEQEIEVRKNLFYEILFSDLDSILALKIYE